MQKFPNLEHLLAQYVKRDFSLSYYPKLRRLDLWLHAKTVRNQSNFLLDSLLQEKKQLMLKHLKITDFDVRQKSGNMHKLYLVGTVRFDDRFNFSEIYLKHLLRKKNYSKIAVEQLSWMEKMYYPAKLQDHKRLASCCFMLTIQAV